MLENLIKKDQELFLYLNGLGTETWDGFWMFLSGKWSALPLYIVLLLLALKFLGLKKTGVLLITIAFLITCTDQLSQFFKYGLERLRPCHEEEIFKYMRMVKSYCGGKYSFFSAHAANSMVVAAFFTHLFRKKVPFLGAFLIAWALGVGYSRIYIGVHYPADVIMGMLVGVLFGWLFYKLYRFTILKLNI